MGKKGHIKIKVKAHKKKGKKGHIKIKVKVHKKNGKKNHKKIWKIAAIAFKSGPKMSKAWFKKLQSMYKLSKTKAAKWWKQKVAQIKKYSHKKQQKHFWRAFAARAHKFVQKLAKKTKAKAKARKLYE